MSNQRSSGEYGSFSTLELIEERVPPVLPKYMTFLLNSTHFGLNFMVILLSVVMVPAQVERLVTATYKGRALGGMVAGGAEKHKRLHNEDVSSYYTGPVMNSGGKYWVFGEECLNVVWFQDMTAAFGTFLVSPLVGMMSDRSRCPVGKRRPMIMVATAVLCVGLLGMALSAPDISTRGNPMDKVGTLIFDETSNVSRDSVVVPVYANRLQEFHCDVDLVARRCEPYERNKEHHISQAPASYEVGNVAAHAHGVVLPRFTDHKSEDKKPVGHLGLYILFYFMVVVSHAAIAIPCIALLSDKTHPSQRGINSGIMGAMLLLGSVSGATSGIAFTHLGVLLMYSVIIAVIVLCVLITTVSITEEPGNPEVILPSFSCKTVLFAFFEPLKEHDFRWVFLTRFFMQQGVSTVTGFAEYWLDDVIPLPYCWSAATSVSLLLLPLLFAAAMSSLVFGLVSDKTGRRKIIVSIAAFIMALGSFVNAFISGGYAYFIAAVIAFIIGLGFGAFQSVDFALVMDILMVEAHKAKDIAIWHQAIVLPQAIAAPLGGVIIDIFEKVSCRLALGYIILFIVASIFFLMSGTFVFKIRRAR